MLTQEPEHFYETYACKWFAAASLNQLSDNSSSKSICAIFQRVILTPDLPASNKQHYIVFLKCNAGILWHHHTNKSTVLFGADRKIKAFSTADLATHLGCAILTYSGFAKKE